MISRPSSPVLFPSLLLRRGGDGERFLRGHFEGSAATTVEVKEVERCCVIGTVRRERERPRRSFETGLERSRRALTRIIGMRLRLP